MEPSEGGSTDREMHLRYAGTCSRCGQPIPQGTRATYSPSARSVRHLQCAEAGVVAELDRGRAGASAMREHARRQERDRARVEAEKRNVQAVFGSGFVGRVATFLAVDDSPRRSTQVWSQGAVGEERVAARLDALADVGVVALHDRRIPGSRANIDHLVVTPWDVWVVDAKRYLGKRPTAVIEGGFMGIGGTTRLRVGGRRSDGLVDGVLGQMEHVRRAVGDGVEVRGALCFVDGDWPLLGGDFTVRGVRVMWPARLARELLRRTPPTIDPDAMSRLLAERFPRA